MKLSYTRFDNNSFVVKALGSGIAILTFFLVGPLRVFFDAAAAAFSMRYHLSLKIGMMSAALLLLIFLINYRVFVPKINNALLAAYAYFFLGFSVIIANELFFDLPLDANGVSHIRFNLIIIALSVVFFVCGIAIQPSRVFSFLSLFAWGVLVFLVFLSAIVADTSQFNVVDETQRGVYLVLSDCIAILGLISLAITKSTVGRVILATVTLLALAMALSRTGFFVYLSAVVVVLWPTSVKEKILFCFASIVLATTYQIYDGNGFDRLADLRVFSTLDDLLTDKSLVGRNMIMKIRLDAIAESPIFGDYWGQVISFGKAGAYIHNILSYWEQFGIIPMVAVAYIMVWSLFNVWNAVQDMGVYWRKPIIGVLVYALVSMLLFRSYAFPFMWFPIGFFLGVVARQTKLQQD